MSAISSQLHPTSIGEILEQAIRLYRKNFVTLIGITATVSLPLLIIRIFCMVLTFPFDLINLSPHSDPTRLDSPFDRSLLLYSIVAGAGSILGAIASIFEQGAIITNVSESLRRSNLGITRAYGRAFRRGWALLGALTLRGILDILIYSLFLIPVVGVGIATAFIGTRSVFADYAVGLIALVCVGILPGLTLWLFFYIRWLFWPQAIMVETKGIRSGLGRSWQLVRGSFWRLLFIITVMSVCIWLIIAIPTYPISFIMLIFPSILVALLLNSTVASIIGIFVSPIQPIILTVLFYDLRFRSEGFGMDPKAKQLAQEASA